LIRVVLAVLFGLFVLFLYAPMGVLGALAFQGPSGRMTLPLTEPSLRWFAVLFEGRRNVADVWNGLGRSAALGVAVALLSTSVAVLAGFAFRHRFRGDRLLLGAVVASLATPSILVGLGLGLTFEVLGLPLGLWGSALAAHLTWTLPFAVLMMVAVLARFDRTLEEAAGGLGARPWTVARLVVLPILAPMIVGVALLCFTLSYDELARSSAVVGSRNTLPLEIAAMLTNVSNPSLYALGVVTSVVSLGLVGAALLALRVAARRRG